MIQDIAPRVYDNSFHEQTPSPGDIALYFDGDEVLVRKVDGELWLPRFRDFEEGSVGQARFLFRIDEKGFFLIDRPSTDGFFMESVRIFRSFDPTWVAFGGITAHQLWRWRDTHQFCGRCGSTMQDSTSERALCCSKCGLVEYPKIAPAVIVAVANGDQLLMARSVGSSSGRFALVAGFVEIGESFEETVKREVLEEVGLHVKNVRYYKSQPWAFSDAIMIGFTAQLDGEDHIVVQESEIAEAIWVKREDIPPSTSSFSIASELIENFRLQK